jgi:hypothetical protein
MRRKTVKIKSITLAILTTTSFNLLGLGQFSFGGEGSRPNHSVPRYNPPIAQLAPVANHDDAGVPIARFLNLRDVPAAVPLVAPRDTEQPALVQSFNDALDNFDFYSEEKVFIRLSGVKAKDLNDKRKINEWDEEKLDKKKKYSAISLGELERTLNKYSTPSPYKRASYLMRSIKPKTSFCNIKSFAESNEFLDKLLLIPINLALAAPETLLRAGGAAIDFAQSNDPEKEFFSKNQESRIDSKIILNDACA